MEPNIKNEEPISGQQKDEIIIGTEEKVNKSNDLLKDINLVQINDLLTEERNNSNNDSNNKQNNSSQTKSNPKSESNRQNRTFVQILQEMFPQRNAVRYVEEGRSGPAHSPLFCIAVHVNGLIFHGTSRTKQSARHEAAKHAIHYLTDERNRVRNRPALQYRRHAYNHRYEPYFTRHPSQAYDQFNNYGDHRFAQPFGEYPYEEELRHDLDYSNRYENAFYDEHYIRDRPLLYDREPSRLTLPPVTAVYHYPSPPPQPNEPSLSQSLNTSTAVESSSFNSGLNKSSDDFTVDDYNDDNFVEFKESNENMDDNDDEKQSVPKVLNIKKERIILRVMSETPVHQNPVSVIHELHPDAKWVPIESENINKRHSVMFKMKLQLPVANESFTGSGRTKKLAKAEAASKALLQMYNISLNSQNSDNPESYVPQSTVQIAQEPLFLKQDIANRIGFAVMLKCNEVWDKLVEIKKWTVLSSIVLTDETDINFVDVICLTSGTKCVKGDCLSMNGYALSDCHAEVLARRCFLHYLYLQIEKIIENNFEDKPEFILERRPDTYGFRLKKNINVHLFISTAPCGDSRVFSPKEENESDAHPNRVTRGVLRAKIEGGEGTIPVKREAILTWDGILQGHQRLQFMSCSDKISLWNVVGIQGALLSHITEPIYLESIVLGSLFNYEHLIRALHGRLNLNFDSNSLKSLPETFRLNKSKVAKCQLKEDLTRQLTKAPPYAINWIKFDDKPEVIACDSGRIHIEGGVSRLSKRSLFARFCSLLGRNAPTLPTCSLGHNIPVIYRDGKTASQEYQRAKTQCMQTFQEQNLGNWIQVPSEIDLFRL